ncbi:MAG: polysaccharide pyruvyl transferase family protein [Coraliomargarita sp.]
MSQFDWQNVVEHLRVIEPFYYVHNSGNAGDTLIYKGMLALFKQHDLRYTEWSSGLPANGPRHLVFSGGGNLVPLYDRCRDLIEREFDGLDSFTLLPHTIDGNEELLRKLDNRFTLFCRERLSFEHCKQHVEGGARVELSHDLAFALVVDRLRFSKQAKRAYPRVGIDRQLKWWKKKQLTERYLRHGGVQFLRTDKEALTIPSEKNLDLSEMLSALQRRREQRLRIADTFLHYVDRAERVVTDRLHVAIAGAILGKPTELYSGSYYKNEAVYAHSIAEQFPHVSFCS